MFHHYEEKRDRVKKRDAWEKLKNVLCWVIIAKDLQNRLFYASDSHVREEGKQVAWSSTRVLANQTRRVRTCWVEVS